MDPFPSRFSAIYLTSAYSITDYSLTSLNFCKVKVSYKAIVAKVTVVVQVYLNLEDLSDQVSTISQRHLFALEKCPSSGFSPN